jgi:hypothetical protein
MIARSKIMSRQKMRLARQRFNQLGAERFPPHKPVDPRKKASRLYPLPARGNFKETFPLHPVPPNQGFSGRP